MCQRGESRTKIKDPRNRPQRRTESDCANAHRGIEAESSWCSWGRFRGVPNRRPGRFELPTRALAFDGRPIRASMIRAAASGPGFCFRAQSRANAGNGAGWFVTNLATAIVIHILFYRALMDGNWILVNKPRLVAPFWNSYVYPWCYG